MRSLVKVYKTSQARHIKVKCLTLLNTLLRNDVANNRPVGQMDLATELANLRITDIHITDLHAIVALVESDRNHDGYLSAVLESAAYLAERGLGDSEYLGHLFLTDIQSLMKTLDADIKIKLLDMIVALTRQKNQRQAVSNYDILSQIKVTIQQARNKSYVKNQAVLYACVRALVNFMKDSPTRFLLVQYVTSVDLVALLLRIYQSEVLEELENDPSLALKTRQAAGNLILDLSQDETVESVRDLFLSSRVDLITQKVNQEANKHLLPINTKISAKYGQYFQPSDPAAAKRGILPLLARLQEVDVYHPTDGQTILRSLLSLQNLASHYQSMAEAGISPMLMRFFKGTDLERVDKETQRMAIQLIERTSQADPELKNEIITSNIVKQTCALLIDQGDSVAAEGLLTSLTEMLRDQGVQDQLSRDQSLADDLKAVMHKHAVEYSELILQILVNFIEHDLFEQMMSLPTFKAMIGAIFGAINGDGTVEVLRDMSLVWKQMLTQGNSKALVQAQSKQIQDLAQNLTARYYNYHNPDTGDKEVEIINNVVSGTLAAFDYLSEEQREPLLK